MTTQFIAEVSYDGDDPELLLFDADGLPAYLRTNIETEHYSGEGHDIRGIYRYDSPGRLTGLQFTCTERASSDEDDYLTSTWQVWEPAGGEGDPYLNRKVEIEFTVTIDGRA